MPSLHQSEALRTAESEIPPKNVEAALQSNGGVALLMLKLRFKATAALHS